MPAPENPQKIISISPLKWNSLKSFIDLRHEIEADAAHLVPKRGERKDSIIYTVGRFMANRRRTQILVATNDKRFVGYISVIFAKFRKLKGNAYLALSVSPKYRNRGIGTELMLAAEKFAKEHGVRRLELEVFGKNEKAINLFKRLGYEEEGRRREAVRDEDGFDDVIFMAKFLN
ncbi:MAG: GNAT family N-acetyltransferase [Candidatus Colwellbacteria bacterium]|nr:GNAT family N-acetyltransferase [Candidatus Colwellbacteria bacterium]